MKEVPFFNTALQIICEFQTIVKFVKSTTVEQVVADLFCQIGVPILLFKNLISSNQIAVEEGHVEEVDRI